MLCGVVGGFLEEEQEERFLKVKARIQTQKEKIASKKRTKKASSEKKIKKK